MKHVTDRLPRWLAGELSDTERAEVEAHLDRCADCAETATQQRRIWDELEAIGGMAEATSSVWPAVRGRTFGPSASPGRIFERRPALGWTLAGGALAAGLLLGLWAPSATQRSVESFGTTAESMWLSDGSWLSGAESDGLVSIWLNTAQTETGDDS